MYENIKSPSDIIAWAYNLLDQKKTEFPKGKMYAFYKNEIRRIVEQHNNKFLEFVIVIGSKFPITEIDDANKEAFLLALLDVVSEFYSQDYDSDFLGLPQIKYNETLKPLNTLFNDKYFVYPKVNHDLNKLLNELHGGLRKTTFTNPINAFLKRFIIVTREEMNEFQFRFISYEDVLYLNAITTDKKILFTFVPFIIHELDYYFDIEEDKESGYFSIKGPLSEEKDKELLNRYMLSLEKAFKKEIVPEIVIFPEMILTERIVNCLPQMIIDLNLDSSSLILAGTLWKDNKNIAYLYNHKGDLLLKQEKFYGFSYEKEGSTFLEKIDHERSGHILNILDLKNLGKIAIFICKDAKSEIYLNLLKLLNVDLVLIPSYSTSDDVLSHMTDLAQNHHCTTVYANVCSTGKMDIGQIIVPSKEAVKPDGKKDKREAKMHPITKQQCVNCDAFCDGIDFILNLK